MNFDLGIIVEASQYLMHSILRKNINGSRSTKIKAAFLLLVFSMNTVVGVACAAGLGMGSNTADHHDDEAIESMHVHADGEKHIHHEEVGKGRHHNKSTDDEDNCCNKHVAKFSQLDKSVPQSLTIPYPIFFTTFVSAFYKIEISSLPQSIPSIKYFVRSYHPPIADIRIAIQSFQI